MYLNGTKCDIYMGTGAGKKLLHEIENAEYSVKILSPFLSPFLTQKLVALQNRNVAIELITSGRAKEYLSTKNKNSYELIQQVVHVDRKARRQRRRWKKLRLGIRVLIGILFLVFLWAAFSLKDPNTLLFSVSILLLYLVNRRLHINIENKRIYSYSYKPLFPFKVVMAPDHYHYDGLYLHGKAYIIDNRIAYLGSLNFTRSGTRNNYETRVRFTEPEAVQKIVGEFDSLFTNDELPELSLDAWGKQLYREPIN